MTYCWICLVLELFILHTLKKQLFTDIGIKNSNIAIDKISIA